MLPPEERMRETNRREASPENPESPIASPARRPRRGAGRHATRTRAGSTRSAGNWVLAIAILQLVFGVYFGMQHQKEADAALQELAAFADDMQLEIDGAMQTVAELRRDVERERLQAFVVPIGLGVVFFGLFLWARRSALPALCTALALYVTVHAVDALADPTQIGRGIVLKVLCIAALASGIKSALQQRAIDQREAEATA